MFFNILAVLGFLFAIIGLEKNGNVWVIVLFPNIKPKNPLKSRQFKVLAKARGEGV